MLALLFLRRMGSIAVVFEDLILEYALWGTDQVKDFLVRRRLNLKLATYLMLIGFVFYYAGVNRWDDLYLSIPCSW